MAADDVGAELGAPLGGELRDALHKVLNLIIPPSDDGRLPGAAEYDVWGYVCGAARELVPEVEAQLRRLERLCRERHGESFGSIGDAQAQALVQEMRAAEPDFMAGLARQTVSCYYQQDRVLEAIGFEARPPFPRGYEVRPGDLSLLDPVRSRPKLYREV